MQLLKLLATRYRLNHESEKVFQDKECDIVRIGSLATAAATYRKQRLAKLKSPVGWSPSSWQAVAFLLAAVLVTNVAAEKPPSDVTKLTTEQVAGLFPKRAQANVKQNWPKARKALETYGVYANPTLVLYALATIRAETGVFSPAPEAASKYSKTIDKAGYAGIQDKGTERPFGSYDSTIKFDKDGTPIINKRLGNRRCIRVKMRN